MQTIDQGEVSRIQLRITGLLLPSPKNARQLRKAVGLSQADLADAIGVNRVTVSRWEAGERRPRGRRAAAYAAALRTMSEAAVHPTRQQRHLPHHEETGGYGRLHPVVGAES
jgi:HTH-type transcriptional regulator/antitoxin MqsA